MKTLIALTLMATAAHASCADSEAMIERLKTKYGEVMQGIGHDSFDRPVGLFISESGTWTIVLPLPDGTACLVAAGTLIPDT